MLTCIHMNVDVYLCEYPQNVLAHKYMNVPRVFWHKNHDVSIHLCILQSGEDAEDASRCLEMHVSFLKRLITGLLYRKWTTKIRHLMGHRHPAGTFIQPFRECATNYRARLRKVNYKDNSSYRSSPPCRDIHIYIYIYILCSPFWKRHIHTCQQSLIDALM